MIGRVQWSGTVSDVTQRTGLGAAGEVKVWLRVGEIRHLVALPLASSFSIHAGDVVRLMLESSDDGSGEEKPQDARS